MNPYPFSALNHFTVPVVVMPPPFVQSAGAIVGLAGLVFPVRAAARRSRASARTLGTEPAERPGGGARASNWRCLHRKVGLGGAEAARRVMPTDVGLEEMRRLIDDSAQVVEVLPSREYAEEHLPGAVNVPLKGLTEATVAWLDKHRAVVVYCWDYF